jgi:superfamily II DNA or RNA helicase
MRIRFDRGTLVLEATRGGLDPSQIPGAAWDDQSCAWRVPAERYRELSVRLLDNDVQMPDIGRLEGTLQLPELRWYQRAALDRWRTADRRGVIALPTGSGKTLVAMAAIAELALPSLVIVPTRVLLDQWSRTLEAATSIPIGRLGDGDYQVRPITVATYASAIGWAQRVGHQFGLVIVDEAHHVGAWCPGEVLEFLVAPARMGLTATPPPEGGELEARVGRVVYSLRVDDLAGEGLSEYKLVSVPITLARSERERYRTQRGKFASEYSKQARKNPDLNWHQFAKVAQRTTAGREALEAWRDYRAVISYPAGKRSALREILERHKGERTLVFTGDNATAYRIARELLVMPITHEIKRAERTEVLAKFQAGEISVLVSSQVLDEGVDVPDADVAVIVGGSSSHRREVQRIGRVLRPRAGKRAVIYELIVLGTTEVDYVKRRRNGLEISVEPVVVDDADAFDNAAGGVS